MKNSFEKFTLNAKKSLELAQDEAKRLDSFNISTEHILLGMLNLKESTGAEILEKFDINSEKILLALSFNTEELIETGEGLSFYSKTCLE